MKRIGLGSAAILFSAGMAMAQTQNGNVTGVITDASGAAIANAQVTVTSTSTGAVRTVTTDASGVYDIEQLPPQEYKLAVAAQGFASTVTAPFTISVGSSNKLNAKLSVGQASTQVEVSADSMAGVNLENAEQSQVISQVQITDLPTETRNPYDFVALSGSISSDPSASGSTRGINNFNIGGARSASTEILLDGIENTYLFGVSVATVVPVDAVQEYRVITSNYGPEYGRASGGVVNVLTKSGTNAFHGSAWEFYRPSTFAANSYYNNANDIPQHRFVRNEFGFVVGGPAIKDKLFFFGGNEWLKVRSSNVTQFYVPTSQFIAASGPATQAFFQQFGALAGTPTGKVLTLGQIGNGSVSSAFSSDRTTLERRLPGVFNDNFPVLQQVNVTIPSDAGGGVPQDTYNPIGRVDFNLSERTQMYGRYVLQNLVEPVGTGNVSPYAGFSTGYSLKSQNLVYGFTHQFGSRLTSQVQLGLLRINSNSPLGANPAGPTMFINSGAAPTVAGNQLVFPGYNEGNAGNGLPSGGPQNNITLSPTFAYTRGKHIISWGGQYTYIRDNHTFAIYENAQEALVSSGTSGALANFQAGVFNYFQANIDPQGKFPCTKDLITGVTTATPSCSVSTPVGQPNFSRSNRYHEGSGFINEEFKATPRLTLNAGLRYELYGTQHNKNHALDSNFYFGTTGTLQDRIRAGKILRAIDTAPAGVQDPNGRLWNVNTKQFAPRISFAYDLTGDGKTSFRGGYGISYERNFGNVTYNVALNPPAQLAISFTNLDVGASLPISTGVLGPFSGGSGVTKAIPPGTVRAVDPRIKPAYSQFYTLALSRQVSSTLAVEASYTGTRGIHNYSIANYNRSYYGQTYENDAAKYVPSGAANSNRLNPQFTSINVRGADGDSYYNGLNLKATGANLYHSGMTVTFNYTFAHSTDNTSSTFSDGQSNADVGGVAYFDPFNKALDHGNSDFDVKHRVAIGMVYKIPDFHTHGLTRAAVGGWEINGLFTGNTGTPFTMYDCGLANITACPRVRFNQPQPFQKVGDSVPTGSPDNFAYITFPTYYNTVTNPNGTTTKVRNNAAYGSYGDPKVGAADLPTILGGMDYFPGMSARNAFRGPGQIAFNADAIKNIRLSERYTLQLRAEAYNILNHANSYLLLGGTNDVSNTPYAQIQKNGPGQGANRQLQLAAKFTF